jgi:hypothetical protein
LLRASCACARRALHEGVMCRAACAAMALASARAGYRGLAEIIIDEQATASKVDLLFRVSQSSRQSVPDPTRARKRAQTLALIVLAGSNTVSCGAGAMGRRGRAAACAGGACRRERPTGDAGADCCCRFHPGHAALASDCARCSGLTAPTATRHTAGTSLHASAFTCICIVSGAKGT